MRKVLGERILWMDEIREHWEINGWAQTSEEADGVVKTARRKAAVLAGGVKYNAQGGWQYV